MTLPQLERALTKELVPVYIVLGDALPLVERAAKMITDRVLPSIGLPAFNHGRYRASEADGVRAFTAARTLPMMADRRLVELRELEEGSNELFAALVDYVGAPCREAVLLVVGRAFPKVEKGGSNWAVRVKKALGDRGLVLQLDAGSVSPARFCSEVAAARGKRLSPADAERLVLAVGADLGRLEQEVDKLALFVGDAAEIDAAAIDEAGSAVAEAVVWDLTAGIASRDADLALGALYRLQTAGDDARKLLGMVTWQMRELMTVAELITQGASDGEISGRARMRGDVLQRLRRQVGAGFPDAAALLRRIATANRQMNSHRAGADRILEGLVLELLRGELRVPRPVPRPR